MSLEIIHIENREEWLREREKIRGIGEAKAAKLLKAFGGVGKLKTATVEEIAAVKGLSKKDAEAVYSYFHKDEVPAGSAAARGE